MDEVQQSVDKEMTMHISGLRNRIAYLEVRQTNQNVVALESWLRMRDPLVARAVPTICHMLL